MAKKATAKRRVKKVTAPKNCYFDTEGKTPTYSDVEVLRRFVTDRGKIIGRNRSGVCAKHQRDLAKAIKQARHLALMPFVTRD